MKSLYLCIPSKTVMPPELLFPLLLGIVAMIGIGIWYERKRNVPEWQPIVPEEEPALKY